MTRERRSGRDRRAFERFNVKIEIEWEGLVGRKPGTISDMSRVGCFILCSSEVEDADNVKIFFPASDGREIQFRGEVMNHAYEIGFAARFVEVSAQQQNFLDVFIGTLRQR